MEQFNEAMHDAWRELSGNDETPIGKVKPGLYHLGNGTYCGEEGWKLFCQTIVKSLKDEGS